MYDDLMAIIKNANTFLITAHVNPEGDSVGSVFAMNYLLRILGKNPSLEIKLFSQRFIYLLS